MWLQLGLISFSHTHYWRKEDETKAFNFMLALVYICNQIYTLPIAMNGLALHPELFSVLRQQFPGQAPDPHNAAQDKWIWKVNGWVDGWILFIQQSRSILWQHRQCQFPGAQVISLARRNDAVRLLCAIQKKCYPQYCLVFIFSSWLMCWLRPLHMGCCGFPAYWCPYSLLYWKKVSTGGSVGQINASTLSVCFFGH